MKVVPTLSSAGFVSDTAGMIDRLFSYYFYSEASQNNLFAGQITSLPKQIQLYGHDASTLATNVRDEMQAYLGSHFDAATVRVRTDIPNPDDPERINLTLEAQVQHNGEVVSVGRLIQTHNSKILEIINLNNEGTT